MLRFWRKWGIQARDRAATAAALDNSPGNSVNLAPAARSALARQRAADGRRTAIAQNLAVIAAVAICLIAGAIGLPSVAMQPWADVIDLALVAGFTSLVGYGELVARYWDSPARLLGARPTPLYLTVNAAAGVAAWLIVRAVGVLDTDAAHPRLYAILLAGFGAIAFFRTAFFTLRIGDTDVGVGPSAVLQSLLAAADRMLDRDQARGRATDVAGIMRQVDFAKAQVALSTLCSTLVQNLTPAEQKALSDQIKTLAEAPGVSDEAKSVILGVYLIRQFGADVLDLAVQALGDEITRHPPPPDAA